MNIEEIAELYVLRTSDKLLKHGFHEKMRKKWYDFKKDNINKEVQKLDNSEIAKLLLVIEKYVENLDLSMDDKSMILLLTIFSSLSSNIWLWKVAKEDIPKYINDEYYSSPFNRKEIYNTARKIAKKTIHMHSEPWFIADVIERHSWLKVKDLL